MGNSFSTAPISGEASGVYSDQDAIEDIYGEVNVAIWSSLDGENAVPNVDRIQSAIDSTDSYVNWMATLYGYATPVPNTIKNWARLSRLAGEDAGIELGIARGLLDDDGKGWGGKMARRRTELRGDRAKDEMGEIEQFFYQGIPNGLDVNGNLVSAADAITIGTSSVFACQERCGGYGYGRSVANPYGYWARGCW